MGDEVFVVDYEQGGGAVLTGQPDDQINDEGARLGLLSTDRFVHDQRDQVILERAGDAESLTLSRRASVPAACAYGQSNRRRQGVLPPACDVERVERWASSSSLTITSCHMRRDWLEAHHNLLDNAECGFASQRPRRYTYTDLHLGPMKTTTFARDGLYRWRDIDAGHRGRAVAIKMGMQIGIHVLFASLAIFTIAMALVLSPPHLGRVLVWAVLLIVVYTALIGTHVMDRSRREKSRPFLVAAMIVVSILLAIDFPYAAYLTIPLSFVYLDHLVPLQACVGVVVGAVAVVVGVGLTSGWSVGGIVGPVAGAAVAVFVGLSLKAMQAQASELERLNVDLLAVQKRLAASQHQAGVLEERARLAREIHDTVAQSLSSIGLLLSAVERTDPEHPAVEQIQLAHRTSLEALSETRGLIAELALPTITHQGLPAVLERLGATTWSIGGLHVDVDCPDTSDLPMEIQTALLRLCQGAMSNVVRHADASHASIRIVRPSPERVLLRVSDDGGGMVLEAPVSDGSFGLQAIRQRVEDLSGEVSLTSRPGEGTIVDVGLPVPSSAVSPHTVYCRQGEPS